MSFFLKDLIVVSYFLGIEVWETYNGLLLSQRKYALDLLQETGKLGAKPACSPVSTSLSHKDDEEIYEDKQWYQRLVGRLIYLTITRPDISYVVGQVSQHMHQPKKKRWRAIERILLYLKGTPGKGLLFTNQGNLKVEVYIDAEHNW